MPRRYGVPLSSGKNLLLDEAIRRGFLWQRSRSRPLTEAWQRHCDRESWPCLEVRASPSRWTVDLDLVFTNWRLTDDELKQLDAFVTSFSVAEWRGCWAAWGNCVIGGRLPANQALRFVQMLRGLMLAHGCDSMAQHVGDAAEEG